MNLSEDHAERQFSSDRFVEAFLSGGVGLISIECYVCSPRFRDGEKGSLSEGPFKFLKLLQTPWRSLRRLRIWRMTETEGYALRGPEIGVMDFLEPRNPSVTCMSFHVIERKMARSSHWEKGESYKIFAEIHTRETSAERRAL